MNSLAGQIAGRNDSSPLVMHRDTGIPAAELREQGVSHLADSSARVALSFRNPLDQIRALAALDGQVSAMLLLSYALAPETVKLLADAAACTMIASDREDLLEHFGALPLPALLGPHRLDEPVETQWLMTTSGTTGIPKIVPHTLQSLTRSVYRFAPGQQPVWGLIYDPTRFAGMQVTLQALLGGGRLVAIDTSAPLADQAGALAACGCTHLSATPTLWRRFLMVPGIGKLPLRQATLGGEIADQSTLNALRASFPHTRITHIYASTEAGVGFSVTDEKAGFPLSYLENAPGNVRLKVVDGILWLRPPVLTLKANTPGIEIDEQGYVRSGDQIRIEGERVYFLGRENGLINIGGVKVYPETVENVVKTVPGVALVQASAKRSPVTGALVLAEVQLAAGADPVETRKRIIETCRERLEREAVPAIIRFVDGFETNVAGKLVRTGGTSR